METITQPPILSMSNLPFILVAVAIAVGFVVINAYMSKAVKH